MSNFRNVTINGRTFRVRAGDVLLDGALANGVDIPHDCRSGTCGTCMVHVTKGSTVCGETNTKGMVYACQTRVVTDLDIEVEELPEISETKARLTAVRELAPGIVELEITPEKGIAYLPGQYFRFTFNGFPSRAFSATAPLDGRLNRRTIHLHVKRVRNGRVTPCLGKTIRPGHRLRMQGPFGHAFLRAGGTGRLVLAGSGTGFAPIWIVACMALRENRDRPIALIAGARNEAALYMKPALAQLSPLPNVKVIAAIEDGPSPHPVVRVGKLDTHIPDLRPTDTVFACGSPRMVAEVARHAEIAGATFYADPFETAGVTEPDGFFRMLKTLLQARQPTQQVDEDEREDVQHKKGQYRAQSFRTKPVFDQRRSPPDIYPLREHLRSTRGEALRFGQPWMRK